MRNVVLSWANACVGLGPNVSAGEVVGSEGLESKAMC